MMINMQEVVETTTNSVWIAATSSFKTGDHHALTSVTPAGFEFKHLQHLIRV